MATPDLAAAQQFLASHARVLDRRRFERLFEGGPPGPVRDAVAAYRNDDGGFGHALEPDGRGPGSQPFAINMALETLDEADAWDGTLVAGALDWLERHAPADGGAAFVDPNIEGWPHAPWWAAEEGLPPSPISTGLITRTLHGRRVDHPWLTKATAWMWSQVENFEKPLPYEINGMLAFLQHVPDRARAERAFEPLGRYLLDSGHVALDPDTPGEVHKPLDYAPRPDSLARRLFDEATIEAHLEHFAAAQKDDGGWTFNWLAWSPVAESEWRGSLTVDALVLLRANGRL